MRALGIEVPPALVLRWAEWFAPDVQPFPVPGGMDSRVLRADPRPLSEELRDTFWLYGEDVACAWLDEPGFRALPPSVRASLADGRRATERSLAPSVRSWPELRDRVRGQVDGHRFTWWPSLLAGREERVLVAYVEDGRRPSRHTDVEERTWEAAAHLLPGARALGGRFPTGSGPTCFGAVMAAGVAGAELTWMQREPFETWLAENTRPGGRDSDVGTVLVWRSPDGLVQHAAVTLGDGWALHKPSQGWMSPTKVLTVDDAQRSARSAGHRLHRHTLRA